MPAGPIGSCWAPGSWSDTAWEEFTWSEAGTGQAATLGDLTTLFSRYAWDTLKDANPNALDVDTLIRDDRSNAYAAVNDDDDANTLYAIYLS